MPVVRPRGAVVLALFLACVQPVSAATNADGRTTHEVYPGQTLGKIAKRYNVSVDALCRANHLRHGARIKPGMRLVIPDGAEADAPAAPQKADSWQDFAEKPRKRGFVILESPTRQWRGYVLSARGKVLPHAKEAIERVFASWRTGVRHEIDPRLIHLVVRLSDTFGGRPIRVVSGYREKSFAVESKHKVGRAFDFSIPGIPNSFVRDYLRTLTNVGVGYYPNSTHVHMDVREESAYWVDDAAPGEAPRYAHRDRPGDDQDSPEPDSEVAEPGPSVPEPTRVQ
jgi:uncharacterized protein YcbK (DUF882 family)